MSNRISPEPSVGRRTSGTGSQQRSAAGSPRPSGRSGTALLLGAEQQQRSSTDADEQERAQDSKVALGKDVEADAPEKEKDSLVDGDGGEEPIVQDVTYWELAKEFSILGFIGFGGPAAHIGLFKRRIVDTHHWMSEHRFMELFSLGSCLPGPTSTQLSFALGAVKKGVPGGLLSGALFQYPGALIMTGLGIASANVLQTPPDWLAAAASGVSAVGVAFVASATKGLLEKICTHPDKWTRILIQLITVLSAAAVIYWSAVSWLFPAIIVVGALVMMAWNWKRDMSVQGADDEHIADLGINMWGGATLIALWLAVLVIVLVLVRTLSYDHRIDDNPLNWFEVFFRTGSIIYGGGQVVLPMLYQDLVIQNCDHSTVPPVCTDDPERSWMTTLQFYTGLGLVQALPGPLFNLAAYLGAIIAYNAGYNPLAGVVLCWIGLFAPGVILVFALLPFWTRFRKWQLYRAALPGMNAASVGLILAAVFNMTIDVLAFSPFPTSSLVIGLFAFAAVDELQIFEPIVVAGGVGLGLLAWGADLR